MKRVDVTLSSDSEDERPAMKTAAGAGEGKSFGAKKQQPAASPIKTQSVYDI